MRALILSTYVKFINLFPEIKPQIQQILSSDSQSRNSSQELQQRAIEYLQLSTIATPDVLVRECCSWYTVCIAGNFRLFFTFFTPWAKYISHEFFCPRLMITYIHRAYGNLYHMGENNYLYTHVTCWVSKTIYWIWCTIIKYTFCEKSCPTTYTRVLLQTSILYTLSFSSLSLSPLSFSLSLSISHTPHRQLFLKKCQHFPSANQHFSPSSTSQHRGRPNCTRCWGRSQWVEPRGRKNLLPL